MSPTIAQRNDQFRKTAPVQDTPIIVTCDVFLLTDGVQALPDTEAVIQAVRDFATFTPDNDPHGEHDFGAIAWQPERIFWKIDYYDQGMQTHYRRSVGAC